MNIWALRSNFVDCEYFFESNSPDILTLCETNLDDSIDSDDLCVGLSSFNPKGFYYSYAWSRSLCWGRTSFCTRRVSRKLCRLLIMFSTGFTSVSVLLLFIYCSLFSYFCTVFDSSSSNKDEVLSINSSANFFVFEL